MEVTDNMTMEPKLNKKENEIMNDLVILAKPRLRRVKNYFIFSLILIFVIISWVTYQYWVGNYGNISHVTTLIIAGQLFTLYGAAITAAGVTYKTERAALMSITRRNANPVLFYELMRTKFLTTWGFRFLIFGFLIQASSMILNEAIGI